MILTELIKIQTIGEGADRHCLSFLAASRQRAKAIPGLKFRAHGHRDLPRQHLVWLEWEKGWQGDSEFSRELVFGLKPFGMVDYSAWTPAPGI